MLIINKDPDLADPDDSAYGGKMVFTFDEPVNFKHMIFLDVDNEEAFDLYMYNASVE